MQKVEIYYDILEAKDDMLDYISLGWRIHTCTMGTDMQGLNCYQTILVIYEK